MAVIKPFGAMRFTEKAGKIPELVCPPYDIISEEQRLKFLQTNQHNIIRLELPREGENPYDTAGATLKGWLAEEFLKCDEKPAVYIYEEEFTAYGKTRRVKGFTCRVRLEEFDKGIVLPHEETLSKAKADRFELMKATGCNFSSIYSLYFDSDGGAYDIIEKLSSNSPDIEFKADDGIIQRLWIASDEAAIEKLQRVMADKKLYIADGHHRYETALNYKKSLNGEKTDGDGPADYIMMTLVNMENDGLVVFPTHRVVRDVEGFNADSLLESCKDYFEISDCGIGETEAALKAYAEQGRKAFGMYFNKRVKLLVLKREAVMRELLPDKSEAYRNLDVSILHTLILERLLKVDRENMANQKNLIYTRDIDEAVKEVDAGANCAFIINPTGVGEIAAVAGANEKMPQKSTYFYPKLITGLAMNKL